ncbi:ATP-dependent Clp protease ATP-binding subunit [bacterium]|nr:ATP-dependent Clp protease ATP-binding subunit [bacterium]
MSDSLELFLKNQANSALVQSITKAIARAESKHQPMRMPHLCDALLQNDGVAGLLGSERVSQLRAALALKIHELPEEKPLSGKLMVNLEAFAPAACEFARRCGAERVSPVVFLATCLNSELKIDADSAATVELLRRAGLHLEDLLALPSADSVLVKRGDFTYKPLGFGIDLTAMARAGYWQTCPLVGAERELKHLVVTVSSSGYSVVVVGEPGVGKSALVNGLAFHVARRTRPLIPSEMDNWTLVAISPSHLLAGTGGRGELEERLNELLDFFRQNPTVIPFFDEIHTLLDSDDASARIIATALKPPMAMGIFRCIGATTDQEYAKFIAADEAMNSRFDKVLICEPDEAATISILKDSARSILSPQAQEMGLQLSDDALRAAVRITTQYQKSDRLPRKAFRLLSRVVAETVYHRQTTVDADKTILDGQDVAKVFSDLAGIPISDLDENRPGYYQDLAQRLTFRVRGQESVVNSVTAWLSIQACGWADPRRPRGRFLFLGPPGVGKTHLSMALAEEIMKDRGSLIVKNMSEYKGEGAKTRFMGADPGYVGFGKTATLYSKVMMRPYSVVVLDEIEKAHSELGDPLLSVLDGLGEDSQGRRVDFSQCIFVMTSNALTDLVDMDLDEEQLRLQLLNLGGIFSAPFVDRIDRIVSFRSLDRDTLELILGDLIEERKSQARRPLPAEVSLPAARQIILDWAQASESTSARGLDRSLMRWLTAAASGQVFLHQNEEAVIEELPDQVPSEV